MKASSVAPWVSEMVESGHKTFYAYDGMTRMAYNPNARGYVPIEVSDKHMTIAGIQRCCAPIAENESASLHDMGDGVMLLEFHSKMNAMDEDIFKVMQTAVDKLHGDASGLVIGNEGPHFCAGANVLVMAIAAQARPWDEVESMVGARPADVHGAAYCAQTSGDGPFNYALGGGAEISMAADRIVAHAETYMGLVEVGLGIIPGWGGCKEMVRRRISPHMNATNVNPTPYLRQVFETVGFAKVAESAVQAQELGFLGDGDRIVMNKDFLLAEAKREVLKLGADGYTPPNVKGNVYAAGADVLASVQVEVYSLVEGGFISEHDGVVGRAAGLHPHRRRTERASLDG